MRSRLVVRGSRSTLGSAAGREQHLVEVGERQRPSARGSSGRRRRARRARPAPPRSARRRRRRAASVDLVDSPALRVDSTSIRRDPRGIDGHLGLGGGQVAVPQRVGIGRDLVVGPAALDRPGMVLGVPAADRVGVALVQQQPVPPLPGRPGHRAAAAPDQHEAARSFSPCRSTCSSPAATRRGRVVGPDRLPGPPVPDDDVAAAVLAVGDHALEVEVLDRVVLDVDGQVTGRRVERRALRHRPADQHTADLEAEVVVEPPGSVALHDEAGRSRCAGALVRRLGRARRLRALAKSRLAR